MRQFLISSNGHNFYLKLEVTTKRPQYNSTKSSHGVELCLQWHKEGTFNTRFHICHRHSKYMCYHDIGSYVLDSSTIMNSINNTTK